MTATGFQAQLLRGMAGMLEARGVASFREDGTAYGPEEAGVYFTAPQSGRSITLAVYDDIPLDATVSRVYVQARVRTTADPLDLELVDGTRDTFHAKQHPLPGVSVVRMVSMARLGLVAGAHEFTLNFAALVYRVPA